MNLDARIGELRDLSPEQLAGKAGRVLPGWVSLLLVIAIAWQLASLTRLLLPSPPLDTSPLPLTTPLVNQQGEGAGGAALDLQRAINAHLFGEAASEGAPPALDPVDAPDTNLNLLLKGTLAAVEPKASLAIIGERNGTTKVYNIGDTIRGGATLHSVFPDRVLLERSGRLEALRLPKEFGAASPATAQPVAQTSRRSSVRDLVSRNVSSLTEVIRPQPVFANGKQRGYRVYPGRQRQKFAALGLRPGDLITEINGTPLDDPAKGMEVFNSLGDATSVTVTVERNGQPEVMVLDASKMGPIEESGSIQRRR